MDIEDNLFIMTMFYCEGVENEAVKTQTEVSKFYAEQGVKRYV